MLCLRNTLLALFIGFTLGGMTGYYLKSQFVTAERVGGLVEVRKADVITVVDMQKAEKTLQKAVSKTRTINTIIREKVKQNETHVQDCGDHTLTLGTVRLLNNARANQAPDSPSWFDGESKATSPVTDEILIDNDLEIVGMYHDLAKRHDVLVDWVTEVTVKQQEAITAE